MLGGKKHNSGFSGEWEHRTYAGIENHGTFRAVARQVPPANAGTGNEGGTKGT
jgi:hypothetical protein